MTKEDMIKRFNALGPEDEVALLERLLTECFKGKIYLPLILEIAEAIHFNYLYDTLCYCTNYKTTLDKFVETFGIDELVSVLGQRDE